MTHITLLDGGMGQELVRRHDAPPTPLWATQVMLDAPHLVADIHRDFFAAGATVATTNTYALHADRFHNAPEGTSRDALFDTALRLARQARDAHGMGRIAGSIGPLGASYRADLTPDHDKAVALYAAFADQLTPHVDILFAETVASIAATRALMDALSGRGKPIWMAFTVDDEDGSKLRSGEPLSDAADLCALADGLMVNCSAPEAIPAALEALKPAGKPFGAYANAFTMITNDFLEKDPTVDSLTARRDMGPDVYARHALAWAKQGATILGGCCEVGPDHIAAMAETLTGAGYDIT